MNYGNKTNRKITKFDLKGTFKPKYLTISTILDFGKYKGMRTSEVLNEDPRYIIWCYRNAIISLAPNIRKELNLFN